MQMTNESIMSRSLEPTGSRIMNDRASPAIFAAGNRKEGATDSDHFVFVDNLGVFGVCKTSVRERETDSCLRFVRQARSENPWTGSTVGHRDLSRQPAGLFGT